jgi:hypothetical protein
VVVFGVRANREGHVERGSTVSEFGALSIRNRSGRRGRDSRPFEMAFIDLPTLPPCRTSIEKFGGGAWAFPRQPHARSISALASSRHSCKGSKLGFAVSA